MVFKAKTLRIKSIALLIEAVVKSGTTFSSYEIKLLRVVCYIVLFGKIIL